MVYPCLRGHPAIDEGELRTMGSKWHNCPINVLLASLFGKSTADQELPFVGKWKITWLFRLWLADQLPKSGNLGANSVDDWRRTLTMMYEGPLFLEDDFQGGIRGQGLIISINEFKKLRERED